MKASVYSDKILHIPVLMHYLRFIFYVKLISMYTQMKENLPHLVRSLNIFHGVSKNQQCCHCTAVKHPGCEAKEINQSKDVSQ